jgi:uncharacterized protein (TIGR02466 family)
MILKNKMNNYISLFNCLILEKKLNIDNTEIKNFILKNKKNGRKLSNFGGYQSNDLNLKQKEIQNLLKEIVNYSIEYTKKMEVKKSIILSIGNMWFNINNYKDFNVEHEHPKSFISGVYYLQTHNKCGDIVFKHPSQTIGVYWDDMFENYNYFNSSTYKLNPIEKNLYLFPSWLKHYVEPNQTKKDRISISFNVIIK